MVLFTTLIIFFCEIDDLFCGDHQLPRGPSHLLISWEGQPLWESLGDFQPNPNSALLFRNEPP